MQPRQGRAGARRAHHAQPHRHRDRHGRPRRARPSPARAGWAGRPTCWRWPSPTGPSCRSRPAAIRTPWPGRTGPAGEKPALGRRPSPRPRAPATRPTTSRMRRRPRRAWSSSTACGRPPWRSGRGRGGEVQSRPRPRAGADGSLTVEGLEPLPFARLAQEAHARRPGDRRGGARLQPLAMGGSRLRDPGPAPPSTRCRCVWRLVAAPRRRPHPAATRCSIARRCSSRRPRLNNAMVGYNTAVGTLVEVAVDATQRQSGGAQPSHHPRMRQHAGAGPGVGPAPGRHRHGHRPTPCTRRCRSTRTGPATAPGTSTAITCRAAATWRYGSRPPRSCRRCRDSEPPKGMAEVV